MLALAAPFGKRIPFVRKHRHMTQRELGKRLGLGEGGANRIAQYEMGSRVLKEELLQEMAAVLDVPAENFFLSDAYAPSVINSVLFHCLS